MSPRARITVVNDNADFLELMQLLLEHESGYETTTIDGDKIESIEPIRQSAADLLIIDLRLRGDRITGWDILRQVRADPDLGELPIILCTADQHGLKERADEVATARNVETLLKPFSIDELESMVARMLATPASA